MDVKQSDLAGPGISTYEEVSKVLPNDYKPLLSPLKRMEALYLVKEYIEKGLAEELNLQMVQVPLIVSKDSGVNDYLDRDGSRTPVEFPAGLGLPKRMEAQIVQAATKWKRMALAQFECEVGQGINTDMRAVRKDYFLDHDHSAYVDQWDWEKTIAESDRTLEYLKDAVRKIWKVIRGAGIMIKEKFPELNDPRYPDFPEELEFFHAEEILDMYPDLPRKQRETRLIQEHPAVFIIGIGSVLKDGYPHEMRAADYDDWITPTVMKNGEQYYGLNGDILVWNPVTKRRHELSSMGIRVTKESMKAQLELSGQSDFLELPYHQAILNDEIPLSIGGGIGQARTYMYLLRTAHLGEVTVSIWPDKLKEICAEKNIEVLE
ncbi:aspartate--ammonia ligase [Aureitalea sp. L0-47]|uniref:aspartate--ammonia ligase n=1 Tax=Aureitalea sp. L0-47 TaxID=2816962 RepID=UPI0022384A2F|nr:aspartate--ammonia ligase [Aureitalea sp. L0-47]MCW5520722.1 aspartate--ammonia ligase [Aureitalea sp. L0-47]